MRARNKQSRNAQMILLFFDGTPESMNGILQEFDFFAYISGLIIHFLKAKIIWIEILFFLKEVFHYSKWKLEWQSTNLSL